MIIGQLMKNRNSPTPIILSTGTQVVTHKDVYAPDGRIAHPAGAVGVVVRSPLDRMHPYRVRFSDGLEAAVHHEQFVRLSEFKNQQIMDPRNPMMSSGLYERVIFRCIIGSRAYGLDDEASDTDYRGVYLPPADLHWSLYGVPEQLENDASQEVYWELQKFIILALKANPNVLECLNSPLVETLSPLGQELLELRGAFLSKLAFQTYSGYVASQFKKLQIDMRNQQRVKWKHVMHLIRLLLSGITLMNTGEVDIDARGQRDKLLDIKHGRLQFEVVENWRLELQKKFEAAFQNTPLPDRPDYERVNEFLLQARRLALRSELP